MYKKIVLVLAVACLIQAAPTDDDLKQKLKDAALKVAGVIKDGGEKLGKTYKEIEQGISVLVRDIDTERNGLKETVKKAQDDAKAAGKDISACVQQEKEGDKAIAKGKWELQACRINPELNKLSLKIAAVAKLEAVLGTAIIKCSFQNRGDAEKIKACVEDIIADVNTKADDAAKAIDESLTKGVAEANKCVSKVVDPLKVLLKKVNDDFADCVSKA